MSVEVANTHRRHIPKCIDVHAHFLQSEVFELCHPHSASSGFGANLLSANLPAFQRMLKPELQVADMDAFGIDIDVLLSCDAAQTRAWATPDEEQRLTALVNDECARWVDLYPTRFLGSGVLPLGDLKMAMTTLDWVTAAGFKLIQMPSQVHGDYLGHPRFIDLLSAISDRGIAIFIHPEGIQDPWYQPYSLWNSIGQSIEEVKVMSTLIYEGLLDRLPDLKIVMAHGGGFLPHYMGRLDRNVTDKPWTAKNLTKKPSEYLSDFYYDTCVYDPRVLELLVERVGVDRVLMGADYPVAALDPIDFMTKTGLSEEDQAKIAGGNTCRLFGITSSETEELVEEGALQ